MILIFFVTVLRYCFDISCMSVFDYYLIFIIYADSYCVKQWIENIFTQLRIVPTVSNTVSFTGDTTHTGFSD